MINDKKNENNRYKKFFEEKDWKDGYELQKKVFKLTTSFPKDEEFGLKRQLNNSSNSIIANMAEAHGRYHFMDKVRVLYIVRGEIEETQSHLIVSQSRGYIAKEVSIEIISKYENLKKQINGKIGYFSNKHLKK